LGAIVLLNIRGGKKVTVVLFLFVVLVLYIIWDNNRILVAEQEIAIEDLPKNLEGFTILQVTDLHEREFGKSQRRLIEAVNSINYDAIVFTGDMLDSSKSNNYHSFYDLIEGIENKSHALYVPGNSDPKNYIVQYEKPFEKDKFVVGMEQRGVTLLESIHTVFNAEASVHFVEFELAVQDAEKNIKSIDHKLPDMRNPARDYYTHQQQLSKDILALTEVEKHDVIIALNHYPIVDKRIDNLQEDPKYIFRNFDLIIAGHYHGGQIRLPFLGALFVPEPWYERNGLFPPQDRVKGLWEYKGTKQYVSTGLGSSDAIPFFKFRFLNPPEINVLTLKKK
jgi:predicted MPP superfamily phosphohydrolase